MQNPDLDLAKALYSAAIVQLNEHVKPDGSSSVDQSEYSLDKYPDGTVQIWVGSDESSVIRSLGAKYTPETIDSPKIYPARIRRGGQIAIRAAIRQMLDVLETT